jgi:methylmalonyl-CoA/ethylmalonyl-CoA epimerase
MVATDKAMNELALTGVAAKFHHVGIVVESIEGSAPEYQKFFGLRPVSEIVTDETQRVKVLFLASDPCAPSLELIEPLPGKSPARGALEKGGGLNHLCFEVDDIEAAVQQARLAGVVCVCPPVPAAAFNQRRVAFLVYKGIGLIEFVEAGTC